MRKFTLILAFLIAAGCSTLQRIVESEEARIIVDYSIDQIVDGDQNKSENIIRVTTKFKDVANASGTETVDMIIGKLRDVLHEEEMELSEKALLALVLDQLEENLNDKIGKGILNSQDVVYVDTFLDWIIESAAL